MKNTKRQNKTQGICFSSVEQMPDAKGSVLFINDSSQVFKDDVDISPNTFPDGTKYMPWGGDNMMPHNILDLIEKDETLSTCQMFNAEVCYGSGLVYNTDRCSAQVKADVEDFLLANSLPSYFLGVCQDYGTGKEVPRGNSGDLGKPKVRKERHWFSRKYYMSVMNIKEFMSDSLGKQFMGIIAEALNQK